MKRVTINLSDDLVDLLDSKGKVLGSTRNAAINFIIRKYFADEEERNSLKNEFIANILNNSDLVNLLVDSVHQDQKK